MQLVKSVLFWANELHFCWKTSVLVWKCLGTNVVGTKVYKTAFSGTLSSGGLLHSDWLPPYRVIAHYHKVDLTSTLLDAGARRRLTLKMNDFWPLWRSRRRRCERTVRLHVEASVVLVSSSLVFLEILYRWCVIAPLPYNNENTDSRSTSIAQIYLDFF